MKKQQLQGSGRLVLLVTLLVGYQTALATMSGSYETQVVFSSNQTNNPQCLATLSDLQYSGQKGSASVTLPPNSDYQSVRESSRDTSNPKVLAYVDEVKKSGLSSSITLKGTFDRATKKNSGVWFYASGACYGTFTHKTTYK